MQRKWFLSSSLISKNRIFIPQNPETKRDFLEKCSLSGNYILTSGNLSPYKNVKTLIDAFLKIKDRIKHLLVIIGRKEFSPEPLSVDERIFYMDMTQKGFENVKRFSWEKTAEGILKSCEKALREK